MMKRFSDRGDDVETRIEVVIALLQGLRIRRIIDPYADGVTTTALARDIIKALLKKPGQLPLPA